MAASKPRWQIALAQCSFDVERVVDCRPQHRSRCVDERRKASGRVHHTSSKLTEREKGPRQVLRAGSSWRVLPQAEAQVSSGPVSLSLYIPGKTQ